MFHASINSILMQVTGIIAEFVTFGIVATIYENTTYLRIQF